jgi:3-phenylpropionate/trans-cinnamate dioxygenase ferredoxin subunit
MGGMESDIRPVRRVSVAKAADLEEGTMHMVDVDGTLILIVRQEGLFALQGTCSHEYFELDKGFLTDGSITCALHLSRFELDDGEPLDPPAELPLVTFPVIEVDGEIVLELPEGEIPVNE